MSREVGTLYYMLGNNCKCQELQGHHEYSPSVEGKKQGSMRLTVFVWVKRCLSVLEMCALASLQASMKPCLSLQRRLWLYTLRQKHRQCLTTSYSRFICIGFFGFLFPPKFVLESSSKLDLMQTSLANLLHSIQ